MTYSLPYLITASFAALVLPVEQHGLSTQDDPGGVKLRNEVAKDLYELLVGLLDGQLKAHGRVTYKFKPKHILDMAGNILHTGCNLRTVHASLLLTCDSHRACKLAS